MRRLDVAGLPDDPLAAAAAFHRDFLPQARQSGASDDLLLVFAPADHAHRGWRLAVIQSLARALAPRRINAVAGDDEDGIAATVAYLDRAPGVTGQYWPLDAAGKTGA